MAMFVYLDEAGDTGFKFRQGSSRYFIITLLLVDDPIPIQAAIDDLRVQFGFAPRNEFKFSHTRPNVRLAFLRMMRSQAILVRALIIDKPMIPQPPPWQGEAIYHYLVRLLLSNDDGAIQDAIVVLDESVKSKKSKQLLATYLRRTLNIDPASPKVRGIRYHDSRSDNLIQAADMVSGAIYAKYHRGDASFLNILRPKISALREWPSANTN